MWLWVSYFPLNSDPPLLYDMKELTFPEKIREQPIFGAGLGP